MLQSRLESQQRGARESHAEEEHRLTTIEALRSEITTIRQQVFPSLTHSVHVPYSYCPLLYSDLRVQLVLALASVCSASSSRRSSSRRSAN